MITLGIIKVVLVAVAFENRVYRPSDWSLVVAQKVGEFSLRGSQGD